MNNNFKTALAKLHDYFFSPREGNNGITSFLCFRFYLTLALYAGSFLLLAHDPFFFSAAKGFTVGQSITSMILAFITVAALVWELQLFGKPAGANLLLHIFMIFPFALVIIRLTGFPVDHGPRDFDFSIMGIAVDMLKNLFQTMHEFMKRHLPEWLFDMVVNWKTCALLIVVFFILSFRRLYLKIGGLALVLVVLLATAFAGKERNLESIAYLSGGLLLLGFGMANQWFQFGKTIFWTNVTKRLQSYPEIGTQEARLIYRLMKDLYESERLTQTDISAFVVRNIGQKPGSMEVVAEFIHRMLHDYHLITIHSNRHGIYFTPDLQLFWGDNMLSSIAIFPRMAIATAFCILWLSSPLDMIPDFIPIFGLLDDIAISAFSGWILKNGIDQNPGKIPEY